jgi:hypothetical protein
MELQMFPCEGYLSSHVLLVPSYAEMTAVGSDEACAYQTPIYFPTSFLFVRGAITTDGAKFEAVVAQWNILI